MNTLVVSFAVIGGVAASACAEPILLDGNFDALTPSSLPDFHQDAGAWGFLTGYTNETFLPEVSVIKTSVFDAGATGNSLALAFDQATDNLAQVGNRFTKTLNAAPDTLVSLQFDIWVGSKKGLAGGGTVYLAGTKGGNGTSTTTDRGPQLTWETSGMLTARYLDSDNVVKNAVLISEYARDGWQSIRILADLNTRRYDVFAGARGEALTQVGNDLRFRSAPLDFFDRVNIARFEQNVISRFDNFSVNVVPAPASAPLVLGAALAYRRTRRS